MTAPMEASLIAADVVVEATTRTTGALDCRGIIKGAWIDCAAKRPLPAILSAVAFSRAKKGCRAGAAAGEA